MGRAVNLVYHASGFLRLCRRAVRKLAGLTLIPEMTKAFAAVPLIPDLHKSLNTLEKNKAGLPPFAQRNQYKGVLDSCPLGPGLSKIIEWSPILSAGLKPEWDGTVLLCYFGVYYPK